MSWPWPPIDMFCSSGHSLTFYCLLFGHSSAVVTVAVLAQSVVEVTSQFAGCDYSEQMAVGSTRDIYSPGYPNRYRGQVNCRWSATAPVGTVFQLQCTDVNLPVVSYERSFGAEIYRFPRIYLVLQSLNCAAGDRILVSQEGRPGLLGALAYCGTNGFTVDSTSNRIVVAFRTPTSSAGGRFLCRLTVQPPCSCGMRNYAAVLTRFLSVCLSVCRTGFSGTVLIVLFRVIIIVPQFQLFGL